MGIRYFDCVCESADHVIRIINDEQDIWLEIQLNPLYNIYQRIILAVKYIFGIKPKYGHWDVTLLKPEDIDEIIEVLNEHKANNS